MQLNGGEFVNSTFNCCPRLRRRWKKQLAEEEDEDRGTLYLTGKCWSRLSDQTHNIGGWTSQVTWAEPQTIQVQVKSFLHLFLSVF